MSSTQHPSETESMTIKVTEAIAKHRGVNPMSVDPPLHSVIDTDALDSLFTSTKDGPRQGTVTFEYGRDVVTVSGNEEVTIESTTKTLGDDR